MREYILIGKHSAGSDKLERDARNVMDEGYYRYIHRHGYHFTPELAEHVSGQMENMDGTNHTWTTGDVESAMSTSKHTNANHLTIGDLTYLANMAYADFYPKLLTETECIRYAAIISDDIDGYEGIAFCRWVSDLIGRGETLDWNKF